MSWDRLESMVRTVDLIGGIEARVADPLWMLSRQWQVGEFQGDDAAQPAAARIRGRSTPLTTYRAGAPTEPARPYRADTPLEVLVEAAPEPDFGSGGLFAAAWSGRRLLRVLRDLGLGPAAEALRTAYPLRAPDHLVEAGEPGRAAVALLLRWALDGTGLAAAPPADVRAVLAAALAEPDLSRAATAVAGWREWYARRPGATVDPNGSTWNDERMEHAFTLGARGPRGELVLTAPEHDGGHLDWYSFDLTTDPASSHGLPAAVLPERVVTAVPTAVRYSGMPASRWWEFEEAGVHFGDIEAGPTDLARLLVAEFATGYANDWFVIPLTVAVGTLTELRSVEVFDNFGGRTPIASTAKVDADRVGSARTWRLFELTGDEVDDGHPAPWLFVPPTLVDCLTGPALERVALARDEAANLAWGIEQLVEGPLGVAVGRADAWYSARPGPPAPDPLPAPDDPWQYRLQAPAPPWWIPFVAELVDPSASAEVRLRRARMQAWEQLGEGQVGPKSVLLDPRRPRWLYEEEVPRDGVRVERSWQYTRWRDGSGHLWLQRRKRPGRGERSSGVRWDLLRTTRR